MGSLSPSSPSEPSRSATEALLSLIAAGARASLATVTWGVTTLRWCDGDLPDEPLPLQSEPTRIDDAAHSALLAGHPMCDAGLHVLLCVPLEVEGERATLWVARAEGPFTEAEQRAVEQGALVLAPLLSQHAKALEQDALRYRHVVSLLSSPAAHVRGERVFLNAAAEVLTGYRTADVDTLEKLFAALYGDDAMTMRAMYELDQQHGIGLTRINCLRTREGLDRMVEFATRRDGEHELWLMSDVTERVQSQERFRVLFEQTGTALTLYDRGGIIDCNPAALALLGSTTKTDLVGRMLVALSSPLQRDGREAAASLPQLENIALAQGSHRFDWLYRTLDGREAPVEVILTPLNLSGRQVFLAEWHDISERLRYQAGLEAARDSALSFARARSDFLATMSHEIRTPMNGVIGMTRLLTETTLDVQQREYVETIRACGEGLLALINDILDFSKLEAGKVQLERITFSTRELVEDATAVLAAQAHAKGLELTARVAPDVAAQVWGDPTRLRQVMLNLLSNAVKFTARGTVEVSVGARWEGEGRQVLSIEVRDTGAGIAPEALTKLFSAFQQEDSSTTRRFGGSGLGLAICKRLVGLMGGGITVRSSPAGSRFQVTIPAEVAVASLTRPDLTAFRIAVLETRAASRAALLNVLIGSGVQVVDAVEQADLVLVDQGYDAESGVSWAHRLAVAGKRVGLIRRLDGRELPQLPGASFVLPGPVRESALYAQLSRVLLAQRPAPRQATEWRNLGARVLVAEDNLVNQRVVRGLLGKLGCEVTIAADGAEALELFDEGHFDVVLMDCQMPVLDGFEATRRIRARQHSHVPIVALTAGVMADDQARCFAAGMDAFLQKPVRVEDLERTLLQVLAAPSVERSGT